MRIYLDNSATTALDAKVLKAMTPYFNDKFGNASSIHSQGQKAREAIDKSRDKIAKTLHCLPGEIIFTSGGSEADNLAIRGVLEARIKNQELRGVPHVITSALEHPAVLKTIEKLEKRGKIEATYVKVDRLGRVNPPEIKRAIKKNTLLVSIMYVNNETGVIQPIREIGKIIEKINKKSQPKAGQPMAEKNRILFHSDAVQAAGYSDLNVDYLHLDMMTLSAHKIYGPKGVGLLYLRRGIKLNPQITGGKQENGLRAGTENVAGIVGLAAALQQTAGSRQQTANKIQKLRDYLEEKIKKEIKDIQINGDLKNRAPHISNISFKGAEGESIILSLDLEGVAVSSGSACTSGSLEPSHVLKAMRIKPVDIQSSIRFSLGKNNTKKEIDYTITRLKKIIKRLRGVSSIWTKDILRR